MAETRPDKEADPEAAQPPRITFQEGERAGRTHCHGAHHPNNPDAAAASHRRSMSRGSRVSSLRRNQSPNYAPLQIEYRTLSIHVTESHAVDHAVDKGKERGEDYFANLTYHELPRDQVCQLLNVSQDAGLSERMVATRLERDGPNTLPKQKTNYVRKMLQYLFGGFCSVLWVGAIIFFLCWQPLSDPPSTQNLSLAVLILVVIFLQAGFSAFQDWSAAKTMNAIFALLPSDTIVRREGEIKHIPSSGLAAGDVVLLKAGDKVPADIRIINHSGDIRFDRALLTGESEEVEGAAECTDPSFLESRNIALMGTTVINGNGEGVVVLTGARSVIGRIANSTSNVKEEATLINREIQRFVYIIVGMTVFLALLILFTWVGWLRVKHPDYMSVPAMLVNVMACIVAFIPEGMPIAVALTLMMTARRMKAVNILPKSLSTVETLGCVDVICSDKTGTLTKGDMFVNSIAFLDREYKSPEEFYGALNRDGELDFASATLHRAAATCNDASFDATTKHLPVSERSIVGNATDRAILRFVSFNTAGHESERKEATVLEIPFNSKNKWMLKVIESAGIHGVKDDEAYHALVKGAPDILLHSCTKYWSTESNSVRDLTPAARARFQNLQDTLSARAERVLLLCEKSIKPTAVRDTEAFRTEVTNTVISDLTIIGMLGIIDPPRPEATSTVRQCRAAGVRFFMVTGDYALTASAIARNIGIFTGDNKPDSIDGIQATFAEESAGNSDSGVSAPINRSLLLEGASIEQLSKGDWDVVCAYEEIAFARTTPEQKLRIVTEFRARHNVVAVTGDGVNDAPALRAADVGVAVATGSDVAIEAANLILLDRFDSIVEAMRLGRLVFQNLQKCIAYLLPAGSWSEIWPVILNVFFGVPLPLNPFLMIIICVFTDLFLCLSLIMEKEEYDLLALPPRNHRREHLIGLRIYGQAYLFTGFMETIAAHSMFFFYMWRYGNMPVQELFFIFEGYSDGYRGHTQEELVNLNVTGQCVYFVALLFLQWGNILSVRNRRLSIVQADPIRKAHRNPWLILSMVISLVIAIFVTEVPGIQTLFGTASIPIEFWLISIPLGLGILCMDEIRKVIVRSFPKSIIARLAW